MFFGGYVTRNALCGVTREQARKLTHLNIAFAPVQNGVTVLELDEREMGYLRRIREYNPALVILISTAGGGNGGYGEATQSDEGLARIVASTIDIVKRYDLDGIDVDWEFPTPQQRHRHTELLAAYRAELDALGGGLPFVVSGKDGAWRKPCISRLYKPHDL